MTKSTKSEVKVNKMGQTSETLPVEYEAGTKPRHSRNTPQSGRAKQLERLVVLYRIQQQKEQNII